MGGLSLRTAERSGVVNGDVSRRRRASSDARYEYATKHVRRHDRDRALIDTGGNWIQHGSEQEQRDTTAGVKALYSMLAATTSGRAKELVKTRFSQQKTV